MIKNVKDRDSEVCSVSSAVFKAGWNNLQREDYGFLLKSCG